MTDRELLEMAAKAAGIEVFFDGEGDCYRVKESGNRRYWNPLFFDGDALRLAVKLHLDIHIDSNLTDVTYLNSTTEAHMADPYAATRRAIVRAAAEIGRIME